MRANHNPGGWFEIYVSDMPRAQGFYEAVLGVKLERLPSPGIEMQAFPAKPELPGIAGALVKMPQGKPSGNGTIIYFNCEDCAVEAGRAVKNGGRVFKEKFSIGQFGFIALVFDPEENLIGLHSMV